MRSRPAPSASPRDVVEERSETLLRGFSLQLSVSGPPPVGTPTRHWVRRVLWQSGFPLVEALSSGDSAEARAPLFAALTGRTASSDFFKPFIIGSVFSIPYAAPLRQQGQFEDLPRVPTEGVRTCMGSLTPRGSPTSHQNDACDVAFDRSESLGTPDHRFYGAQ